MMTLKIRPLDGFQRFEAISGNRTSPKILIYGPDCVLRAENPPAELRRHGLKPADILFWLDWNPISGNLGWDQWREIEVEEISL